MAWVIRDNGAIVAAYDWRVDGAEELPDDHPDLVAFLSPPDPVPQVVSRFQARAALHIAGKLTDIEALVARADPIAQIAWADAQEFRRDSPTVNALAARVGMTDADLDNLFRAAAKIVA